VTKRSIHNFKGCLYRVKQINLHYSKLSEMEILAQPLCETVFTPTTFRHTKWEMKHCKIYSFDNFCPLTLIQCKQRYRMFQKISGQVGPAKQKH
jgi:hypothetical protein